MDEIIEELRALNVEVLSPLELPDDEDILDVESQLFVTIDGDFRDFLLTVSDVICGSLEPVTVADPNFHTYLPEVAAVAWDQGLSREMLPLCEADGGYYCVDMEGQVSFWQDGEYSDDSWEHVWLWVQDVWMVS